MVVEDTAAFVEELEVPLENKTADKQRRRVAESEIELLKLSAELRLATDLLVRMELAEDGKGAEVVRARVNKKREELSRKRTNLKRLEQKAEELDRKRRTARTFRLHSADHYVNCSEARYAALLALQKRRPVLVSRRSGRRWWWYRDRFWWGDSRSAADEVMRTIHRSDLDSELHRHVLEAASAGVFSGVRDGRDEPIPEPVPEGVRLAVWRRDLGRCVDCGSAEGLQFERVTPLDESPQLTPDDFELRCRTCTALRTRYGAKASPW